jgi:hypothetical protein
MVCVCECVCVCTHIQEAHIFVSAHIIEKTLTDTFLDLCSHMSAAQIPHVFPHRKGNHMKYTKQDNCTKLEVHM